MDDKVADQFENGECPDCGEPIPNDVVRGGECQNCGHVWNWGESEYTVQAAIDAQAQGYGDARYWDYLEEIGKEYYAKFMAKGLEKTARKMMTRSLSESLQWNDGL